LNIAIVVTHLLGAGHLRRAINLGNAIKNSGGDVTVISGGVPVEHFDTQHINLVQLPAIKSDGTNFTSLLQPGGRPIDSAYMNKRSEELNRLIRKLDTDAVITELFPFGRRVLRNEFISLLDTIQTLPKRTLVLSSVRDILAPPSSEKKAQKTEELISRYYDAVLVHSDEKIIDLSASWPVSRSLQDKLCYTGFVSPEFDFDSKIESDTQIGAESTLVTDKTVNIVVSAGSGSVGLDIYKTAIHAAAQMTGWHWHILVGGSDNKNQIDQLKNMAHSTNICIEPVRKDFRTLLTNCSCSVSMCGYNTAIDLLQAATPGVLIPFDSGGETEQTLRAQSLAKRQSYQLLLSKDLTAENLINAIDTLNNAQADTNPGVNTGSQTINFNGAKKSVGIIDRLLSQM